MRIGIDIGGMSIKIGMVDDSKQIVAKKVIPTQSDILSPEEVVHNIADAVLALLAENNLSVEQCKSIGIACPGLVDGRTGVVLYSNNIAWENVPMLDILREKLNVPMYLANDADAAALGEVIAGAAQGKENAILLTLGTGVGGGVIINGKIFAGPLRGGCELGHTVIKRDGKQCTCGQKGCLETYASATALMEQAREAAVKYPESFMNELSGHQVDKIDGRIIFEAEKRGDEAAKMVVDNYEEDLSIGITNFINVFRPEVIILGGGVSAQEEYLTDALQRKVDAMVYAGTIGEIPRIVTSKLKNDAGIIGAAYLS
ncbi:MAG: ROK family protein [Lachnospiraceae bacterium]|nr:ROK family protein [Lachnospiraceae bacterium]MBR3762650.1 ROK family protein [Lachnospiraceae bacterium]